MTNTRETCVNAKHAYLIIAHNEFEILEKLIDLLDDERNDLYVHIDKKVKRSLIPELKVSNSHLEIISPINVSWGGDNMIECELRLLEAATKQKHAYYHLLSGVDLPIKSQDYIHDFFNNNCGKEFIDFDDRAIKSGSFLPRIKYYHFLQNKIGRNAGKLVAVYEKLENNLLKLQSKFGVDRTKNSDIVFYKGTNWFSITHELAKYLLSCERMIKKYCYNSLCADEVFLQTFVKNSEFGNNIVDDCLRCIDWNRGAPYTYTAEDYDFLINSPKLYARKFSINKDAEIVDMIYNKIKSSQT